MKQGEKRRRRLVDMGGHTVRASVPRLGGKCQIYGDCRVVVIAAANEAGQRQKRRRWYSLDDGTASRRWAMLKRRSAWRYACALVCSLVAAMRCDYGYCKGGP